MEMHRSFWLARSAGGEADQAHVVAGGVAYGERVGFTCDHRLQAVGGVAVEIHDAAQRRRQCARGFHVRDQPRVTDSK